MRKNGWTTSIALIATTFLVSCSGATSRTIFVAPPLIPYSAEVQALAGAELQGLGPPCLANEVTPGCSALRMMINDYKWTRDRIRAAAP